jgi:hypothetical protein
MPTKLEPPSVVRTIALQVPEPVRHRAVPSIHHSSRLTAVNEVGWKSAGMTPPGGTGNVVAVEDVVEVVEDVDEDVDVVELVEDVDVAEGVDVLPQAAPARVSAATVTPISARL